MEWNGTEVIAGMGGTVVRASSSFSNIPPRLVHVEKLLFSSSSSSSASNASHRHHHHHDRHPVAIHYPPSEPLARNSLPVCPNLVLPQQKSSVSHSLPFSFLSSSSSSSSPSRPAVSLMSSRLAPAYSSFCGLTRLESRGHRGPKCTGPGNVNVKASVEIRANSALSDCCWNDGRVAGKVSSSSSGCMENDKNGQRIECYSSSGSSQTAASGGGDQPISSSSVLPPTLPAVSKVKGLAISFCPRCGGATEEKIPVGEHEKRYVCTACGAVHYQNPKMVVGCLVEHEGKILLCRRNIEPSFGLWTLPAGYMEMGESAAEGAARETLEEACAHVRVLGLFAHLDIPVIGQSHIYFRAQLKDPHIAPGPESIECALFKLNEVPFDSLAFSSIQVALKMYIEDAEEGKWRVHHAVIDKRPGAGPSDLKGFVVRDVLSS